MYSHPLSARKTREAARAAVVATNKQAESLVEFQTQTRDAYGALVKSVAQQHAAFFARGFWGRLKFLATGK